MDMQVLVVGIITANGAMDLLAGFVFFGEYEGASFADTPEDLFCWAKPIVLNRITEANSSCFFIVLLIY
jgi:hypothetical protein